MELMRIGRTIGPATVCMGLLGILGFSGEVLGESAGPADRPLLDQALAKYEARAQVSGTLRIAGSDTMRPLMVRLAAEFNRRQPNAKINVEGGGSAVALPEFLAKSTYTRPKNVPPWHKNAASPSLIIASSRNLTPEEISQFALTHGYEPTGVPVAMDAVAIYVHKDNPLRGLPLEQLDAILSSTRKRGYPNDLKYWDQLGLGKGWEQAPIHLYGRNLKSGTRGFVKDHVLLNGEFDPHIQEEPGAASVILALSRDTLGLGYSGIGLVTSSVRAIPLAEAEGKPYIEPTATTVMDGTYPLRRFLYLYVDKSTDTPLSTIAEEFLSFLKSRDGQEAVMKVGFYPLTYGQLERAVAALIPAAAHSRPQ